jgi:hypothetical protein
MFLSIVVIHKSPWIFIFPVSEILFVDIAREMKLCPAGHQFVKNIWLCVQNVDERREEFRSSGFVSVMLLLQSGC